MASAEAKNRRNKKWKANRKAKATKGKSERGKKTAKAEIPTGTDPAAGVGDVLNLSTGGPVKDANLERRAMNNGWLVPEQFKPALVQRQLQIAIDPEKPDKETTKAFVALERADARARILLMREEELDIQKKDLDAKIMAGYKPDPSPVQVAVQVNNNVQGDPQPVSIPALNPMDYLNPEVADKYDDLLQALGRDTGSTVNSEGDTGRVGNSGDEGAVEVSPSHPVHQPGGDESDTHPGLDHYR